LEEEGEDAAVVGVIGGLGGGGGRRGGGASDGSEDGPDDGGWEEHGVRCHTYVEGVEKELDSAFELEVRHRRVGEELDVGEEVRGSHGVDAPVEGLDERQFHLHQRLIFKHDAHLLREAAQVLEVRGSGTLPFDAEAAARQGKRRVERCLIAELGKCKSAVEEVDGKAEGVRACFDLVRSKHHVDDAGAESMAVSDKRSAALLKF